MSYLTDLTGAEFFNVPRKILLKLVNKHKAFFTNRKYTKSCIRIYLYLISRKFEGRDKAYILRDIKFSDIAKELTISNETVKNSLKLLQQGGIIMLSHGYDLKHHNILFCECKEMYLKKNEYPGAEGYVRFSLELINELLSLKNVNALRYAIYQLANSERLSHNKNQSEYNENVTYNSVRYILSDYYRFRSHFKNILYSLKKIFRIKLNDNSFNLAFTNTSNVKKTEQDKRTKIKKLLMSSESTIKEISSLYVNSEKKLKSQSFLNDCEKIINDMVNLAIEYGSVDLIKAAIERCYKKYGKILGTTEDNKNKKQVPIFKSVGAAVRTEIRKMNLGLYV